MEPKRWVNEHESPEVRRALRAGVAVMPPPDAERACWTALGAALATSGSAGALAASAGTKASVSPSALGAGSLLKLLGIGASAGVLVSGGAAVVSHLSRPVDPPSRAVVATPSEPRVRSAPAQHAERKADVATPAPPGDEPLRAPVAPAAPERSRASATERDVETPAPRVNEESALVLSAHKALRAGDPAEALQILDRAKQSFGRGSLAEERLALEIDASLAAGRTQQAKRAARAFLERYPQSPHAARFRALP